MSGFLYAWSAHSEHFGSLKIVKYQSSLDSFEKNVRILQCFVAVR
jgi:predicted HTH domain antitoxin